MSSAYYPLGMNTMPSSGYNHKSTYLNKQYVSWKGIGLNSNPVGTAPGHIRPLTNNDPGNVFQTGFGLPRPIKHYRKGRVIPPNPGPDIEINTNNPHNKNIELTINEGALINYNTDRFVKSSKGTSLGGGFGGSGLLSEIQDKPGSYSVKLNTLDNKNKIEKDCKNCKGVEVVVNYYPNKTYLTENPEINTTNKTLCCNEEQKAKQRVIYASTNLNKNYYTTTKQYLQNRCKTYSQKAFNFLSYNSNNINYNINPYYITVDGNNGPVPGSPLSLTNTYLANCQLNTQLYEGSELAFIYQMLGIMINNGILTSEDLNNFNSTGINTVQGFFNWIQGLPEYQKNPAINIFEQFINNPYWGMPPSGLTNPAGCQLTVYKPNNYQFAKQGAVSSSTRLLKLNVDTISTNAASINNYNNTGQLLINANELYAGNNNNYINLLKNKYSSCNAPRTIDYRQSGRFQNKKYCYYESLPSYRNPISQLSPYRYYPGTVFNSNHFSQSPNTYNTTAGTKNNL